MFHIIRLKLGNNNNFKKTWFAKKKTDKNVTK